LRMNHRIFVFILDLIAAFLHALVDISLAAGFRFVTAPTNGEKEHRLGALVKMLMEPHLRRHKDAARTPLDSLHGLAFLPHQRVARAPDDQNVNARAMTMRLFVCADTP